MMKKYTALAVVAVMGVMLLFGWGKAAAEK